MPLSPDQLRHLLADRSEPASYRPVPHERIRVRIRRARIRRTATAGLVAAVTVVSVLGIATALHRPSSDQAAAAGQPFPTSFTASGGASYRQVAVTSLTLPAQKTTTVTVTHGSHPIDVIAECNSTTTTAITTGRTTTGRTTTGRTTTGRGAPPVAQAALTVNGTHIGELSCPGIRQLIAVPAWLGGEAAITFTKITLPKVPDASFSLRFAVYEENRPS